ncbi:hypothetical protein SB775_33695, partial [Peribacillus sp. SIMBA_075]|uniref:hypothetical protein n=1 Tax=Peribacillus sp. SIMBA_075 TaxID=3085813 RepID=UPI00397E4AA0
ADAFGGGAKVNEDGTISAPSYSVGGETVDNVGDAVSALDGAVAGNTDAIAGNTAAIAGNTTAITELGDQINSGSVGLV